ncbi:hypothetical protein NMG60_11019677 [Bertholletia excelsa]
MLSDGGGRLYWARSHSSEEVRGIVVIFAWVSIRESHLKDYVNLYSALGWKTLVCQADFLNLVFPERATSLAFAVLNELIEYLRSRPCPIVLAAFSSGSKACLYKVFQVLEGACEVQLSMDDTQLIRNCISGHIYDSCPVDFTSDLGTRYALHPMFLSMPGSAQIVSLVVKGVASGLDALFLTKFGSQRAEYWHAIYSSVNLEAPFLIFCSENDEHAPYPAIYNFAHRLQELGGSVELVKWNDSPHVGHYRNYPIQYRAAVTNLLEKAISVYSQKGHRFGERSYMECMHDQGFELRCDLQNAAVDSNLRRVAHGLNDHYFLPNTAEYDSARGQDEHKEGSVHLHNPPSMNAHSVLGEILFDACVPKNVEGWDIKFSSSLNGRPIASAHKHSPFSAIKCLRRSRL